MAARPRGGPSPDHRFSREADALARLAHPVIASIYEVGRTSDGRRYIAMERVDGQPLRAIARRPLDDPDWGLRRRLELFVAICEGVGAAHARGVIHRDLKPSNILVDRGGRPRILDFGLARLAGGHEPDGASICTEPGQIMGTVTHMSPEQVRGELGAVDARSDVYALGVILYELLTGRLPFDLAGRSIVEAARAICEGEPAPLSSASRVFRGDLDTIVARAMDKERHRRYPLADGPEGLAKDVRRFLRDQPITARRASPGYRLRKLVRRRRAAAIALAVAVPAIAVAAAVGAAGLRRAAHAAARADTLAVSRRQAGYTAAIEAAHDAVLARDARQAGTLLDAIDPPLRGWEWRYLKGATSATGGEPVEVSPDVGVRGGARNLLLRFSEPSKRLELLSADATSALVVLDDVPVLPWRTALLPEGGLVVMAGAEAGGGLAVRDAATGAVLGRRPGFYRQDQAFDTDPAGTRVVLGGTEGRVWVLRLPDLSDLLRFDEAGAVADTRFSPDGRTLATVSGNGVVRIRDSTDARLLVQCDSREHHVGWITFTSDGRRLAGLTVTGERFNSLGLWDVATGRLVRRVFVPGEPRVLARLGDTGRLVVGCGDGSIRVYPVEVSEDSPWTPLLTIRTGTAAVVELAASPDGGALFCQRDGAPGLVWRVPGQ